MPGRDLLPGTVRGGQRPGGQREPRDEGEALASRRPAAFRQCGRPGCTCSAPTTIGVDLLGGAQLIDVDLGQADVRILPSFCRLPARRPGPLAGPSHPYDAADTGRWLDAEAPQAHLALLAQVARDGPRARRPARCAVSPALVAMTRPS